MKEIFKQIIDEFIYGWTGKLGNVIDFQSYKTDKLIKQYGNDPKICLITFIIFMAVGLFIIFS